MKAFIMAAIAAFLFTALATDPAEAKRHHRHHHVTKVVRMAVITPYVQCDDRYPASCGIQPVAPQKRATRVAIDPNGNSITFIPNPPGTWRVRQSCAHRLAAYWGLGKGLDKVSTWPHVFSRAGGPGVGLAAVRGDRHHIMGIIGGSPGAWQVVDFNSGGHRNRAYTVSNFGGYFFVDPRTRVAMR